MNQKECETAFEDHYRNANPFKHKRIWGNWIICSLVNTGLFSMSDLLIGSLSAIGMQSVFYYNSGSLLFTVCYFGWYHTTRQVSAVDLETTQG
jgi:hypothetical protein